jgi:hypothetical protein
MHRFAPVLAALALTVLSGCGLYRKLFGDDEKAPPPPSPLVTAPDFSDIPVPRDFVQIPERSKVVVARNFRSGTLAYRGMLHQETLRDWYKQAMPAKGWSPVAPPAGETGAGPYTLRFEKDVERCEILIESPAAETFATLTLGLR